MTSKPQGHSAAEGAASTDRLGYDLVCADAAVRRSLVAWLDETRLAWPGRFRLTVSIGKRCPFALDDRTVLHQPTVDIQAGPPSGTVRLSWDLAPAVAEVHPTRPEAEVWLSRAAVARLESAERSFLLVLLVFVLRRLGWYHVHGAAVIDLQGRGWLIAGSPHSGKSTTTALLATRGWQVGTDDIGFLAIQGDHVVVMGTRSRIALRGEARKLLGARGGIALSQRGKQGFWPEDLGGSWVHEVVPRIIAFPRIGEHTGVVSSVPREALSSLVKWSQWVLYEPVFADEHLGVLGRLASQARCFDLTLGPDLFGRPDLLEALVP